MKPGSRIATPVVPPERDFIKVAVSVLDREPVPNADDGALERGVEALGGVDVGRGGGVRIDPYELVGGMVDPQMGRELSPDPAIGGQIVRREDGTSVHHVIDEGRDSALRVRASLPDPRLAAPLHGDGRHHLARAAAPLGLIVVRIALGRLPLLALLASDICLVGFDDATQLLPVLLHHRAEPVSQEPRGLVADPELATDDHARHALAGRSEQEDRAEPCAERQVRPFHRRAVQDRELRPAGPAHPIAFPLGQPECVVDDTALRAHRAGRPAHRFEVRETGTLRRIAVKEGNQIHDDFHKRSAYESQ